jgi:ABC-2 type transport system permease protein
MGLPKKGEFIMMSVLAAKIRLFMRRPGMFIVTTLICILMSFVIGTANQSKVKVPVSSELSQHETKKLLHSLNQSDLFSFQLMDEEKIRTLVSEGKAEAGVKLKKDDFDLIISSQTANTSLIRQYVQKVYIENIQTKKLAENLNAPMEEVQKVLKEAKENPVFTLEKKSFRGEKTVIIDGQLQSIFGFSLFFVIYTIAFNVLQILKEKREGIWDRMILSPLKKWEMYTGNLIYSFVIGYAQVALIFSVFHFGLDIDFHGRFTEILLLLAPYVFAIVALSIFITGIVKNEQQFNAMIPLIAVSMAMIGGAYWPLEIVSSKVLLTLAKFVPVTYGMELLKGAAVYGNSISELLYPVSILCFMGVVLMGLGINIMERRNA